MSFLKVADVDEQRWQNSDVRKRRKCLLVGGRSVTLFLLNGAFYCMDSSCHHHGGPMYKGDIEEIDGRHIITCQSHGYRVMVETGEEIRNDPDSMNGLAVGDKKQRVHQVEVRGTGIFVKADISQHALPSDKYNTNITPPGSSQPVLNEFRASPGKSPGNKISQTQLTFRSRKRAAIAAVKDSKHRRIEYDVSPSKNVAKPLFLPLSQPGHPRKLSSSPRTREDLRSMRQPLISSLFSQ